MAPEPERELECTLQPTRIAPVEPMKVTAPQALPSSASTQVCCPAPTLRHGPSPDLDVAIGGEERREHTREVLLTNR